MTQYKPLLRFGSQGAPVRHLQSSLNQLNPTVLARLTEDGIFGLRTLGRVVEFQRGNALAADGVVGPMTWGEIETLVVELGKHGPFSKTYRLPNPVTLEVAAIYLPSFKGDSSIAISQFPAAADFLKKYNIFLDVWPEGGKRQQKNSLNKAAYNNPVPNEKTAYVQLRRDLDTLIFNNMNRERDNGPLPVVFCEFKASGKAVTPHSTARFPTASPACLISISASTVDDELCIAHEMGHSALYPLARHNDNAGNLMHEVSGRTYLFRFQVEAFARATFAR